MKRISYEPIIFFVVLFFVVSTVRAEETPVSVPPALSPWIEWVKDEVPERNCSLLMSDRVCAWPGRLRLDVGAKGGTFEITVVMEKSGPLSLPGSAEVWPLNVSSATKVFFPVLSSSAGNPEIWLPKGKHEIHGEYAWQLMPKTISLPAEVSFLDLKIDHLSMSSPKISGNDLWLQESTATEEKENDSIRIQVSRKVIDGVPLTLLTNLELRVSGKARELVLGEVLPAGMLPYEVESSLPYKKDSSSRFTVQLKPGVHNFLISAVSPTPPQSLRPPSVNAEGWPEEETWVFEPNPELRDVEIGGVSAIDANRTEIPDDWKSLQAYAMPHHGEMLLKETRRGEHEMRPNSIELARQVWLDLDGGGATVSDRLAGKMNREWRLDVQPGYELTRATVDGVDQVITENSLTKNVGVELRKENINVQTVSRLNGSIRNLSAVGWDLDVDSLRMDLHVGPGWTVLEAVGADNNPGTWLGSWRLWDLFFLCLISIATAKLLGLGWGFVTLFALTLSHREYGAPTFIWLNLLAGKALIDALPAGRFRKAAQFYAAISFMLLLAILIPFSIDQIRLGLYPQLSRAFDPGEIFMFVLVPVFSFCAFGCGVTFLVLLFKGMFRRAFQMALLGLLFFAISGAVGLISSEIRSMSFRDVQPGMDKDGSSANEQYLDLRQPMSPAQSIPQKAVLSKMAGYGSVPEPIAMDEEQIAKEKARKALIQVDPNAVVQTGASVPNWNWKTWSLSWTGPVQKNRNLSIYLLSPGWNCAIAFLRVLLLVALSLAFLRAMRFPVYLGRAAVFILVLLGNMPAAEAQSFPDEKLLSELQRRVFRETCISDCVSTSRLTLNIQGDDLVLTGTISSRGSGAWPIPGPVAAFVPSVVTVNGVAVDEFRRTTENMAWIRVPSGVSKVEVKGTVKGKNTLTVQFGIVPKHVDVEASDWTADGLNSTGGAQETLQLIRKAPITDKSSVDTEGEEPRLASWFLLEREVDIALPWTIRTVARRMGETDRAEIVRFPLLPGESVTSIGSKVENRAISVTFPRDEESVEWSSVLTETPEIQLLGISGEPVSETWTIRCSAIWRCAFDGLTPVRTLEDGEYAGVWQPFPGEGLRVTISKPSAVTGSTLTLDSVALNWKPGAGLIQGNLNFAMRSSQATVQKIKLSNDAVLESVMQDGVPQALSLNHGDLSIPVTPGAKNFVIHWRQDWTSKTYQKMPSVDLFRDAANVRVNVSVPERRWLLFVCGPKWGPAVLFWGELIIVITFGIVLGRLGIRPLNGWQWILLGLGMATLHPALMLLPAICFGLLSYRSRNVISERWKFNTAQLALGGLALVTLIVLFLSIYHGLIVEPDMNVSGNESTNTQLYWFADRIHGALPQPAIVSLPMWFWRLLMLAWSSWLVFAVLRWIKWAWLALNEGGLWKGRIEEGVK